MTEENNSVNKKVRVMNHECCISHQCIMSVHEVSKQYLKYFLRNVSNKTNEKKINNSVNKEVRVVNYEHCMSHECPLSMHEVL